MTKIVTLRCAVILALVLAGCAKQPQTSTLTSSPAPGGGPGSGYSGTGSGRDAAAGGAEGSRGAGGAGGTGTRPALQDFREVAELKDVHFEYDKADLRETDLKVLDVNAGWLREHPSHLVVIEGHCDERGTNEYNTALGDRRAKTTMNYLVSRGIAASRITVVSYGEERPSCKQHADECWAKNRRAHFLVKPR